MAVLLDISENGAIRETDNGIEVVRIAVVTEVDNTDPSLYLKNALDTPGLPALNDPNPMYPGLKCRSRRPEDDGCGNVRVVLTYGSTGRRATLERQEPPPDNNEPAVKNVSFGLTGKQISQAYDVTAGPSITLEDIVVTQPSTRVTQVTQYKSINVFRPVGKVSFERLELDPPLARFRAAMGKVNDSVEGPYARGTLLCDIISAQSQNDGDWYQVRYEFRYDPAGWEQEVLLDWPGSGDEPAPEDGTSRKRYRVYDETDFSTELNLDFTD